MKAIYIEKCAATFLREGEGYRFAEPDYKQTIPNASERRRMSRIVKMGTSVGLACTSPQTEAILTATGLGCLADTEKFMQQMFERNDLPLSPTPFIHSTFNTIGAQIAMLTGNHGYNNTYVHRALSFESALTDAALMLEECPSRHILVGAIDELTPSVNTILHRFRADREFPIGEGAAFFRLTGEADDAEACITDMESGEGRLNEAYIDDFLRKNNAPNAQRIFPSDYKKFCGEYATAISFALWMTLQELPSESPILIANESWGSYSMLLLRDNGAKR